MFKLTRKTTSYTYEGETIDHEWLMGVDANADKLRDRLNIWGERNIATNGCQVFMRNFENSCSHPGEVTQDLAAVHIEYIIEHMVEFDTPPMQEFDQ